MAYDLNTNPSRPHDLATETPSEAPGDEMLAEGGTKGSSKAKTVILAVLAVVAVAVVAWQFLRAKGPQEAAAATPAGDAAAADPSGSSDIDAVLRRLGAPSDGEAEGFTVTRVEQLVNEFDTYVRHRQVASKDLHSNPFEVILEAPPAPVAPPATAPTAEVKSAKALQDDKAAAEKARLAQVREAGGRLKLGSILVSAQSRMAVINETVCVTGDVVEGFRVESIDADRVVLSSGTVKVELKMFERGPGPGTSKGHS